MKKNFYIQPQTELMQAALQSMICTSNGFGGNTSGQQGGGMGGEAPIRFEGPTQGLKYLI